MKPVLKDVLAEKGSLSEHLHCADQIIRGMRVKSVFIARRGAVTVLLAAPLAAHGGIVLIESKVAQPGTKPCVFREYGYLERLHVRYREQMSAGARDAAAVYEALDQARQHRNELLNRQTEAREAEESAGLRAS